METLLSKKTNSLVINNLVRIGDLLHYDGPLLTLFEDVINECFYIFDWVDRDSKYNRWLIYKVSPISLSYFINGKYSHYDLFENNNNGKFYVADIENKQGIYGCNFLELIKVPVDYYPSKDYHFNASKCSSIEIIKNKIKKAISRKQVNEYMVVEDFIHISFKYERINQIGLLEAGKVENKAFIFPIPHSVIHSNNKYVYSGLLDSNVHYKVSKEPNRVPVS